jgi:hypothetical protein
MIIERSPCRPRDVEGELGDRGSSLTMVSSELVHLPSIPRIRQVVAQLSTSIHLIQPLLGIAIIIFCK